MKIKLRYLISIAISILLLVNTACKKHHTPKPRGYFRISFPAKEYQNFNQGFPYKFQYPKYSAVSADSSENSEDYWLNIIYPEFNGQIHLSYKNVNNNIYELLEDSRRLAFKHSIKADAINEQMFYDPDKNVIGILYNIKGDAASPLQFFATDSINHFIRGSVYFNNVPNHDSLAPVIKFVKEDVVHLMETLEWNK